MNINGQNGSTYMSYDVRPKAKADDYILVCDELQDQKLFSVRPNLVSIASKSADQGVQAPIEQPDVNSDKAQKSKLKNVSLLQREEPFEIDPEGLNNDANLFLNQHAAEIVDIHSATKGPLNSRNDGIKNILNKMAAAACCRRPESRKIQKHKSEEIAIVGSGPIGLATAHALAKKFKNINIKVLDLKHEHQRKNNIVFPKETLDGIMLKKVGKPVSIRINAENRMVAPIKHIENALREHLREKQENVKFVPIDDKITNKNIGKYVKSKVVILATGAKHDLAKNLGFKYEKRNFNEYNSGVNDAFNPIKNSTNFSVIVKVLNEIAEEVESKAKGSNALPNGLLNYTASTPSKNGTHTTFSIVLPVLSEDRSKGIVLDKSNREQVCHKMLKNLLGETYGKIKKEDIRISSFDIQEDSLEMATDYKKAVNGKTVYLVGDQFKSSFYPYGEGLQNGAESIDTVVRDLAARQAGILEKRSPQRNFDIMLPFQVLKDTFHKWRTQRSR